MDMELETLGEVSEPDDSPTRPGGRRRIAAGRRSRTRRDAMTSWSCGLLSRAAEEVLEQVELFTRLDSAWQASTTPTDTNLRSAMESARQGGKTAGDVIRRRLEGYPEAEDVGGMMVRVRNKGAEDLEKRIAEARRELDRLQTELDTWDEFMDCRATD
jgi:hypothetical protein